jgi:very-short-patch-repair endonuclease
MRKEPTFNEAKLWRLLRDRQLAGLRFRRQVPVGPYIADFMSFRHRLIIEADGPTHLIDVERDQRRDAWLLAQGFRVMRFPNEMIANNGRGVLAQIREALLGEGGATPHPTPFGGHLLPQGEKGI